MFRPISLIPLKIKFKTYERRLAKELYQALGLTRPRHQPIELVNRHHDDSVLALPRNELWPLRSGQAKHLTETGFCILNLPCLLRNLQMLNKQGSGVPSWVFEVLWHIVSVRN